LTSFSHSDINRATIFTQSLFYERFHSVFQQFRNRRRLSPPSSGPGKTAQPQRAGLRRHGRAYSVGFSIKRHADERGFYGSADRRRCFDGGNDAARRDNPAAGRRALDALRPSSPRAPRRLRLLERAAADSGDDLAASGARGAVQPLEPVLPRPPVMWKNPRASARLPRRGNRDGDFTSQRQVAAFALDPRAEPGPRGAQSFRGRDRSRERPPGRDGSVPVPARTQPRPLDIPDAVPPAGFLSAGKPPCHERRHLRPLQRLCRVSGGGHRARLSPSHPSRKAFAPGSADPGRRKGGTKDLHRPVKTLRHSRSHSLGRPAPHPLESQRPRARTEAEDL